MLRIVDFYRRQPTDLADYFTAAWQHRHRAALGQPQASLHETASRAGISGRYLQTLWSALHDPTETIGPIAQLQAHWQALPSPGTVQADAAQPCTGCEQPITGYHETNFSMAYSSHISWQSADSPVPMEVYPSLAFDSLFENRGNKRTQSILDRVKDDASSLSRKISSEDNRKLDEYLTSVREVEKRVDRTRRDQSTAEENARHRGRPLVTMNRPDNGLPEDIRDHMRLMCDIVALAFQTRLPLVTVGGLGGTLQTGRVLDFSDAGDDQRKLCGLHLALMERIGVKLPRFGDADAPLVI